MAAQRPLFLDGGTITRFQTGDFVEVQYGGTGATSAAGARSSLGLAIGSDVMAYSADLAALDAMDTVGFIGQTAAGVYAARVLQGSSGRITVSNGNSTAGNPVFDLATLADAGGGALLKIARDSWGRVSGSTPAVEADLTPLLDSVYARKDGAVFTGPVQLSGTETAGNQAASRQFVLDTLAGAGTVNWAAVRAASLVNVNVASPGASVGGVTMAAGQRVLLAGQTAGAQNGFYVWNGAAVAMTRTDDANEAAEFQPGRSVFVNEGTSADNTFTFINDVVPPTLGTTVLTFTQTNGAGQIDAGSGMTKSGNTLNVIGTAGRIVANADSIDLATVSQGAGGSLLKVTIDAYGRISANTAVVASDIAALLDADLTAIAAVSTMGSLHRTANNTWTTRTLTGTAGKVAVTNGDGVAGNPTVNLVPTGVTAGTYQSVTVDADGRVTAGTTASSETSTTTATNGEASAIAIGRAVYPSASGAVKLANANSSATVEVIGLMASGSTAAGAGGSVAVAGMVEATTAQWDAVTGQTGGLTFGAKYYLSNSVNGAITTTPPSSSSGHVLLIGRALSSTKLALNIGPVIAL